MSVKIITIPKDLAEEGDLVVIPRRQYEQLLRRRKVIAVSKLTRAEKKAVERGRREVSNGAYITLGQLINELARPRRKKR